VNALLFCDDPNETAILTVVLQLAGLTVTLASDLDRALRSWPERPTDLLFLALRHGTLVDQVHRIRTVAEVPLVAVSNSSDEDSLCQILEAGADLVSSRPYSARLLGVQLRALLRRSRGTSLSRIPTFTVGGLTLDATARTVQVEKREPSRLTQLEFRLLYTLISHLGQTLPTETIVERVWGYSGEGSADLVRGLISRLRAKVEVDRKNPQYIQTIQGAGYRLLASPLDPVGSAEKEKKPGS
jgi:two-component system KDP operon response regulator KdpE